MTLSTAAAFWAVSFMFVITPGADWAYAISAGLRHRTVVPAVGGMLTGHLLAAVVVAAGVAGMLSTRPTLMTALTLAGAGYLIWLGKGMLTGPTSAITAADGQGGSWLRWAATGLGVSGLNPKLFLLFVALLPQFLDPTSGWSISRQIMTLGLLHVASCAVVYFVVGMSARIVLRSRPAAAAVVTRISGFVMVVIGLVLIAEQFLS